jgi:hypothetical protein
MSWSVDELAYNELAVDEMAVDELTPHPRINNNQIKFVLTRF